MLTFSQNRQVEKQCARQFLSQSCHQFRYECNKDCALFGVTMNDILKKMAFQEN